MAEYYTQSYFPLATTREELDLLLEIDRYIEDVDRSLISPSRNFLREFPPSDGDPLSGFMNFLRENDMGHAECFADMITTTQGETHCAPWNADLHYLATVLQRVCKSALPITFSWAAVASVSRDEDFGGGVMVIEANKIWGWSSFEALEEVRTKLSAA